MQPSPRTSLCFSPTWRQGTRGWYFGTGARRRRGLWRATTLPSTRPSKVPAAWAKYFHLETRHASKEGRSLVDYSVISVFSTDSRLKRRREWQIFYLTMVLRLDTFSVELWWLPQWSNEITGFLLGRKLETNAISNYWTHVWFYSWRKT